MVSMEVRIQDLICVCFTLAHVVPTLSKTTHLFGASPSGGLWGTKIEDDTITRLSGAGFPSSLFNKHVSTATFDHSSRHVLIETSSPHSLYFGPLCSTAQNPPIFLANVTRAPLSHPDFGDCVNCEATAFTVYYSKIYFLMTGDYMAPLGGGLTRIVQVRKFKSCDECSYMDYTDETDFLDISRCSEVVLDVYKKTYMDVDDTEVRGGKHMAIKREDDESLSFFFQMGNITSSDAHGTQVVMTLWHANSRGYKQILHEEKVDSVYGSWDISSLGSVAIKDSLLCWSTGDRVYCATFLVPPLRNVRLLLTPGQTVISEACKGPQLNLLAMVSGVAIVKTRPTRAVVFGCYPQSPGTGGAGLITFGTGLDSDVDITPLSTDEGPLQGGAMFVADRMRRRCDNKNLPHICLGRIRTTPAPETTPEAESKPEDKKPDEGDTNEVETKEGNGIEEGEPKPEPEEKENVGESNSASATKKITFVLSFVWTLLSCILIR